MFNAWKTAKQAGTILDSRRKENSTSTTHHHLYTVERYWADGIHRLKSKITSSCVYRCLLSRTPVNGVESLVFTCTESEEEAQVWSASQETVDSQRHPPVPLVDQFAAEVLVDLARDSDIWRRPGATAGWHWCLVVDGGEQRRVEVATVVLLDEVVSRV